MCMIISGSYGLPKPWYFLLTKTYWCGSSHKTYDTDLCNLFDVCRKHVGYSLMEEDQAEAIGRDPGIKQSQG